MHIKEITYIYSLTEYTIVYLVSLNTRVMLCDTHEVLHSYITLLVKM